MNKLKFKLYEKFNGSSLDFLDVGDVIWANRYVNLDDKENFEIGHEKGPFVIIAKEDKKVFGLYCTTSPKEERTIYNYVKLDKKCNVLAKDTYISTNNYMEIKKSQYLEYVGTLSDSDINYIFKVLVTLRNIDPKKVNSNIKLNSYKYKIGPGDILKVENGGRYYYISEEIDDGYLALPIKKVEERVIEEKKNIVNINGLYYQFSYGFSLLSANNNFYFENFADDETQTIIDFKHTILGREIDELKTPKIRQVINYMGSLYLIYSQTGGNYVIYDMRKKKTPDLAWVKIKYNNATMHVEISKRHEIPQDELFFGVGFISEEEYNKVKEKVDYYRENGALPKQNYIRNYKQIHKKNK